MNRKKGLVIFLSIVLILECIIFQNYIARNQIHHCSETHCPVCMVLHEATGILGQIAGALAVAVVAFFIVLLHVRTKSTIETHLESRTLIKWKVRMDH